MLAVDDVGLISQNRLKSVRQQFLFWFFGELCVLQGVLVASIMEGLKPDYEGKVGLLVS